jgi:putative SOS response-associated peptidase YedK
MDEFGIGLDATEDDFEADYNVAPTKPVPAVLERSSKEEPEQVVRQLRMLRWGLVPSWAKDLSIGAKMINARAETVAEKPAFRRAFAKRRCLLPADGYFEWYVLEEDKDKKKPRKQPFFIRPADGDVMAMAGLYEFWKSPDDEWITTCTVITTEAPDDLGRIHDRMPMVVRPEKWDAWLDPATQNPDDLAELLVPAMAGTMDAFPVSNLVSNVKNNGPELIQPLSEGDISGKPSDALF